MKALTLYYKFYFNKILRCLSNFTYIKSQRTLIINIDIHATCETYYKQHMKHFNATYETSHMQHGHAIIET